MADNQHPPSQGATTHRLAEWIKGSDEWQSAYGSWIAEFFEDFEELIEGRWFNAIQTLPPAYQQTAFETCLEDFMSYEDDEDGNVVESYIRQMAESLSPAEAEYLTAVRGSSFSLYRITEVVPKSNFTLVDLLRKGEPFTVEERVASQYFKVDQPIGARVIKRGTANVLTGKPIVVSEELAKAVVEEFDSHVNGVLKEIPKLLRKAPGQLRQARQAVLEWFASLVTAVWLHEQIVLGKKSPVVAESTDPAYFRLPLLDPAEVIDILDGCPFLKRSDPGEPQWLWQAIPDQDVTWGIVWLTSDSLDVETSSSARQALILDRLTELLGENLGEPMVQTDEEDDEALSDFDPDEFREEILSELRGHLDAMLDQRIETLGGTPREAARDPERREHVAAWLRLLENPPGLESFPRNDLGWMWIELGIEDLRN